DYYCDSWDSSGVHPVF
nr:immunoglobulin light chain junction region [Macaca mulatta]MOY17845.1 immunoglobulin light chain junction region [Macaca mulatta]MOY17869.1 immunoglobulin light chain junction region [Macaca mulatta]